MEQIGFPLRSEFANENHGEAGSSKQCNDQHTDQTAFFLAPIITDLIRSTRRELYDAEIGVNWFLDQKIPKGGYVRILAESLLWEERFGKTRIRNTEGFTTCMEPHGGLTIASSSWNFLRKRWLHREQELITVIQEGTKRSAPPFFQSAG